LRLKLIYQLAPFTLYHQNNEIRKKSGFFRKTV